MQVTLIHNAKAGAGVERVDVAALADLIRAEGHTLRMQPLDEGWELALERPADLVAILGGDGTVGQVARRMIGRGVPLAALAAGTANNIAMTLGTEHISAATQVKGWARPRRLPFDACRAHGPWGRDHLLEGLGCGLFAWGMRTGDGQAHAGDRGPTEKLVAKLAMLSERVSAHPTTRIDAALDGEDLSGDYVLLEAMNTQFIGPNLFLAPHGRSGDGLLDVVTVDDAARAQFREQLASWRRGALRPAQWPSRQGKHLTLRWTGFPLHLDDRTWPEESDDDARSADATTIELCMEPGVLEFLVPADTEHPPVP
ncbi:MAG TPA: diacylglycerol kinase family protein [Casimicrobiaceae bacterium]